MSCLYESELYFNKTRGSTTLRLNCGVISLMNVPVVVDHISNGKQHFEVLDELRGSAAFLIVGVPGQAGEAR
jgi:hypothetical protein